MRVASTPHSTRPLRPARPGPALLAQRPDLCLFALRPSRFRLTQPEWGERTRALGVNLQFASQMLGCTKPQLVQMGRKIGTEALFDVIDCFSSSKRELDAWAGFTETAYARLMVAASVMARGDDAA